MRVIRKGWQGLEDLAPPRLTLSGWANFLGCERHGDVYKTLCPMHNDTNPSLQVGVLPSTGALSLRCWVCPNDDPEWFTECLSKLTADADPVPDHTLILNEDGSEPTVGEYVHAERPPASADDRAELSKVLTRATVADWDAHLDSDGYVSYLCETGADLQFLHSRGVRHVCFRSTYVGPRQVLFPFFDAHGNVVGGQRRFADKWLSLKNPDGARWANVGFLAAAERTDVVVIAEGCRDSITACAAGFDTIVVAGTNGATPQDVGLIAEWLDGRPAVILFDNDDAGRQGADRLATSLIGLTINATVQTVPHGKDLTAWRLAVGEAFPEQLAALVGTPTTAVLRPTSYEPIPVLSDDFWAEWSRLGLPDIRGHARSIDNPPDAVLGSYLACVAASTDYRVRVDTGMRSPATPTLVVALVGQSGDGKSESLRQGKRLSGCTLPSVPPGSGEGIAARLLEPMDDEGTPTHNLLIMGNEGTDFLKLKARQSSTLESQFLQFAQGEQLGHNNKEARIVQEGTYAGGACIGFQYSVAGEMLQDSSKGLPQRFVFLAARDTTEWLNERERMVLDGIELPRLPTTPPYSPDVVKSFDDDSTDDIVIKVAPLITRNLRLTDIQRKRISNEGRGNTLQAHAPVLTARLALFVHLIRNTKGAITEEEWNLAEMLTDHSTRVTAWLVDHCARENVHVQEGRRQQQRQSGFQAASREDRLLRVLRNKGQCLQSVLINNTRTKTERGDEAAMAALCESLETLIQQGRVLLEGKSVRLP